MTSWRLTTRGVASCPRHVCAGVNAAKLGNDQERERDLGRSLRRVFQQVGPYIGRVKVTAAIVSRLRVPLYKAWSFSKPLKPVR